MRKEEFMEEIMEGISDRFEVISEKKRDGSEDHVKVLKALMVLPFPVGKQLLIDILLGDYRNRTVVKCNLDENIYFGIFQRTFYKKTDLERLIDSLITNGFIELTGLKDNPFIKVLKVTKKGENEISNPSFLSKKISSKVSGTEENSEITESDRAKFSELDFFLNRYNDKQKKAIISDAEKIICIAGAGSGKTTVLTKRIEFMVKYRGIPSEKILAVTFTRKARKEMIERLEKLDIKDVHIETFNSFSEKILKKYGYLIYDKEMKVMSFRDKIYALNKAFEKLGIDREKIIDNYFSKNQKRDKTPDQLMYNFLNDCFFVLDYFKTKNEEIYDFSEEAEEKHEENARTLYEITSFLQEYMKENGLRDYTDQIIDCIRLFKEHQNIIPEFGHILIDEYQDVNSSQIELLEILEKKTPTSSIFAVGDPRQAIFGWRGSNINYILKFNEKYSKCEVINLEKNYRSSEKIVNLMNSAISDMKMKDLQSGNSGSSEIKILDFSSEDEENEFVTQVILNTFIPREEIFVLARTNRQLSDLSRKFSQKGISFILKNDDSIHESSELEKGKVTLATVHSIKGLEAEMVFVIGCNEQNFPCKASDHPVIELIKVDEYDKEEEEKRLFYVAISRAKNRLYMTYSGKKSTYFITSEMRRLIQEH